MFGFGPTLSRVHSVRSNVDFDLLVSAEAELVLAEGSHFTFVRMSEVGTSVVH